MRLRIALLAVFASLRKETGAFVLGPMVVFRPSATSRCRHAATVWLRSAASGTVEETKQIVPQDVVRSDAVICGGGPAGLLSAIMLAQKFPSYKIKVYDRLSAPPSPTDEAVWSDVARFYLIGLGGRGQTALQKFGVWDKVKDVCTAVVGRKDWSPESPEGVERILTDRPVTTQVLPRDKLVGVLYDHIRDNYSQQVELNYGYEVTPLDLGSGDGSSVLLRATKCSEDDMSSKYDPNKLCDAEDPTAVSTSLLIAADGTSRTIANVMEEEDRKQREKMNLIRRLFAGKPFRVTRYEDDNQRVYKTVPFTVPTDWRPDLNYSARSTSSRIIFEALPANRNGYFAGVLLIKEDDPLAAPNADPKELRKFFVDEFPQFNDLVDDDTMASVAKKSASLLPAFRYVGPRLHQGDRTVILGDCAHTVKPYFGLGANSALEDVELLSDAIDSTDSLSDAVYKFSKERAPEARALVEISRGLDRPGKLGFVTSILPLILDSIFHKLAPKVFEANTIRMLQREGYGFRRVQRRKRLDRLLQVAVIGAVLGSASSGAVVLVRSIANLLGRKSTTVLAGMTAIAIGSILTRKLAEYFIPGMVAADALAKTNENSS